MNLRKLEEVISTDRKGIFTIIALLTTIGIYVNLTRLSSSLFGTVLSITYFTINSVFGGNIFFKDENPSARFVFGLLLSLMLVATGGAAIIVASALISIKFDTPTTTALLILITVVLSLLKHTKIAEKVLKD